MGVMIATIGIVFGTIFQTPMSEFLPFLSVGIIVWGFISSVVTEGCTGFIAAEEIIKQLPIPLSLHILRVVWRNTIILAHNAVIFPILLLVLERPIGVVALLALPGFFLLLLNLTWIALFLGIICARYRDLPQIVASVLQIVFYLTPIMWMSNRIPTQGIRYLLIVNPVYHMLELVRAPLLGQLPSMDHWVVVIAIAVLGWIATILLYNRYMRRIAYWL